MKRNKKALDIRYPELRYPNVKNNNKYGGTSVTLDTRDESHVHEGVLLGAQSNSKNLISSELSEQRLDSIERQTNVERKNIARRCEMNLSSNLNNEVPESCKFAALQDATELTPKCLSKRASLDCAPKTFSRKKQLASVKPETSVSFTSTDYVSGLSQLTLDSGTSAVRNSHGEIAVGLIYNKNVPDKSKRAFSQGKINDRVVSNNFSQLTHDSISKDREAKEVENGVTALPARPTRSLPADLKAAVERNDEKESRLVQAKLPNLTQSFTETMPSTTANDDPKSTRKCKKLVTGKQVSFHPDTNVRKIVCTRYEAINEKNHVQNEEIHKHAASETKDDEQSQLSVVPSVVKRKRGRPKKIRDDSIDQGTPKKIKGDDTLQEIPDTLAEAMPRTRRASKIKFSNISDSSCDSAEDETFVVRRGRPPGSTGRERGRGRGRGRDRGRGRGRGRGTSQSSLDAEYIPRLAAKDVSLSRTKESNKVDDTDATAASNIDKVEQLVTCAKCDQEVPKKQWPLHKLHQHNNMAWRKDEEPLDFENDEKLLKKVLTAAIKQKKKFLTCEKCEVMKRSVAGFMSHMQFCGKSEQERQALMITCPICDARMMPSSVEVHERYHRQQEQSKNEASLLIEKTRRKAAEKAMPKILEFTELLKDKIRHSNIIQTPGKKHIPSVWKCMWAKELASKGNASCKHVGCTYSCSSYETICEHYYQCEFAAQENFVCKMCTFSADCKDKIVSHIREDHFSNIDLQNSDYEIEEDLSDDSSSECNIKRKFNRCLSKMSSDNTSESNK